MNRDWDQERRPYNEHAAPRRGVSAQRGADRPPPGAAPRLSAIPAGSAGTAPHRNGGSLTAERRCSERLGHGTA